MKIRRINENKWKGWDSENHKIWLRFQTPGTIGWSLGVCGTSSLKDNRNKGWMNLNLGGQTNLLLHIKGKTVKKLTTNPEPQWNFSGLYPPALVLVLVRRRQWSFRCVGQHVGGSASWSLSTRSAAQGWTRTDVLDSQEDERHQCHHNPENIPVRQGDTSSTLSAVVARRGRRRCRGPWRGRGGTEGGRQGVGNTAGWAVVTGGLKLVPEHWTHTHTHTHETIRAGHMIVCPAGCCSVGVRFTS